MYVSTERHAKFRVDTCDATDVIQENRGGGGRSRTPHAVAGYGATGGTLMYQCFRKNSEDSCINHRVKFSSFNEKKKQGAEFLMTCLTGNRNLPASGKV